MRLTWLLWLFPALLFAKAPVVPRNSALEEMILEWREQAAKGQWNLAQATLKKIYQWLEKEKKKNPHLSYTLPKGEKHFVGVELFLRDMFLSLPKEKRKPFESRQENWKSTLSPKRIEQFIRENPFSSSVEAAWKKLAALYLERGEFGRSLRCFSRLKQWRPLREKEILQKAFILAKLGRVQEAKKLYSKLPPKLQKTFPFPQPASAPLPLFPGPQVRKVKIRPRGRRVFPTFPLVTQSLVFFAFPQRLYAYHLEEDLMYLEKKLSWMPAYVEIPELQKIRPVVEDDKVFFSLRAQKGFRILALHRKSPDLKGIVWDSQNLPLGKYLQEAYWVSPLTAGYGKLYFTLVRWEKSFQVFVFCISTKGELLWRTQVLSHSPSNPFGLSATSAEPSLYEGVVFVNTNLGGVAALDAESGEILWISLYQTFSPAARFYWWKKGNLPPLTPPLLQGSVCVTLSHDSPYLYGWDRHTGKTIWKVLRRGKWFVVPPWRQWLYGIEGKKLYKIHLKTGEVSLVQNLPTSPFSPPVRQGELLYVPGKKALLVYHLGKEKLLFSYRWSKKERGTLAVGQKYLLVVNEGWLFVYPPIQSSPKSLSPLQLAQWGEHYLRLGLLKKGLSLLEKAYQQAPLERARKQLLTTYLQLAKEEQKPSQAIFYLKKALTLCREDREYFQTLWLSAKVYRELSQPRKEVEVLHRLLSQFPSWRVTTSLGRKTTVRTYAAWRIGKLIKQKGRKIYPYDEEAKRRFEAALRSRTKEGLWEVILKYPNSQSYQDALDHLVSFYLQRGLYRRAIELLKKRLLTIGPDPHVYWQIVFLYENLEEYEKSLFYLKAMEKHFGKEEFWKKRIHQRLRHPRYRHLFPFPSLTFPPQKIWRTRTMISESSSTSPYVLGSFGEPPSLLIRYEDRIECRSLFYGFLEWNFYGDFRYGQWKGISREKEKALVVTRKEVALLHLKTGQVLWRRAFSSPIQWGKLFPQRVWVFCQDKTLWILERNQGRVLNQRSFSEHLSSPLLWRKWGVVYGNKKVMFLDLFTGEVRDFFSLSVPWGRLSRPLRLLGKDKLCLLLGGKSLLVVSLSQKRPLWKRRFSLWVPYFDIGEKQILLNLLKWQTKLVAFSWQGKKLWQIHLSHRLRKVVQRGGKVFLLAESARRSHLYLIQKGEQKWHWSSPLGLRFQEMLQDNQHLYLANLSTSSGRIYVISKRTGKTVEVLDFPGKQIRTVSLQKGVLVVLTNRGGVAFSKREEKTELFLELEEKMEKQTSLRELQTLAALFFRQGLVEKGLEILEDALWKGKFLGHEESLWDQVYGYREECLEKGLFLRKIQVHRVYTPIEVDGQPDDWWGLGRGIPLQKGRHFSPLQFKGHRLSQWEGEDDLSGEAYFGWDKKYFYFLLIVYDDREVPYDPDSALWKGDCLLIAIDYDGSGGYTYGFRDTLLTLALQIPKKKKPQQKKEEEKRRPQGKYAVKRSSDETMTIYEVAIPWSMFRRGGALLDPKKQIAGFTFGLNLAVTDDDGEGPKKVLHLRGGLHLHQEKSKVWQYYIPRFFAKIELVP